MPAEHEGPDPLMAVLTGEGLPDEARTDPSLLAAHHAAEADVTLLRAQLKRLGDTLADAAPPTARPAGDASPPRRADRATGEAGPPQGADRADGHGAPPQGADRADGHGSQPRGAGNCATGHNGPAGADAGNRGPGRTRRRPRGRALALGTLVTAVAVSGALGASWLITHAPGGDVSADGASSKAADAGAGAAREGAAAYLACARLVVEGTVTAVQPGGGAGQQRVTLRVTRSYKPAKAPAAVTFTWEEFLGPRPAKGDHALVGIPRNADVPDTWVVDPQELAQERDRLDGGLSAAPGASGAAPTACP
ncbi:hypothetical protein AB0E88_03855 [Streptomyces sp. NPDC028635]|uniref:hypothetical protein n=1 Tax=Streptomyces sp. NPDC028635 TaxID=3154800 RepID=UPI0033EBFA5C